jgi:alpha-L-fucosidase 2
MTLNNISLPFILLCIFLLLACDSTKQFEEKKSSASDILLFYKQPAEEWNNALPLGNGRLGAMVFGGITDQKIQFNEESLWAGTKINPNNPLALEYLDSIRQLLFMDKNEAAYILADKALLGKPPRIRSYQTFGSIIINHHSENNTISDYRRQLNLNKGISTVQYNTGESKMEREVFVSTSDDIVVIHLICDKGNINADVSMTRPKDASVKSISDKELLLSGQIVDEPDTALGPPGKHMKFASILKIMNCDGNCSQKDTLLEIRDASQLTLILTAYTNYEPSILDFNRDINPISLCKDKINELSNFSYRIFRNNHISTFKPFFERMQLSLDKYNPDTIPTDIRLERVQKGQRDNALIAEYFQFGRYLLLSSSGFFARLPANLQGVWNHHINAPWCSDFHTNINLQMNYWPVNVCNLSECFRPYYSFFEKVKYPGQKTAEQMYGARGWTMHHVTDVFGYTAVNAEIQWGMFPVGGSWVSLPLWRHFEYNKDTVYLKNHAWPLLKGASEFILDFLIESPRGYLVTSPSYSPENSFYIEGTNEQTRLTYAPTMDIMIIRELFDYTTKANAIVAHDTILQNRIDSVMKRLPPLRIGSDSTIMEWIKDYREVEPGHRHMSHLFGLYPGTQISAKTPKFFKAARKTIERRLKHGGAGTGWSRAWIINFYARLKQPDECYKHLIKLLQTSTLPNLFDLHPPFQIDGNFGAIAGIAEMLLQSHQGFIEILPVLPREWETGEISGICARGGFELSFSWENGILKGLEVLSHNGLPCTIQYKEDVISFKTEHNKTYLFTYENGKLEELSINQLCE